MPMTSLVVELVVTGVFALLWLAGLAYAIFEPDLHTELIESPAAIVLYLSVSYVLGIIIDRLSDLLFGRAARRLRAAAGFSSPEEYENAKDRVYLLSPTRDLIEHSRSRIRFCRGCVVNVVGGLVAFLCLLAVEEQFPLEEAIAGCMLLISLGVGSLISWRQLTLAAYKRTRAQASLLKTVSEFPK